MKLDWNLMRTILAHVEAETIEEFVNDANNLDEWKEGQLLSERRNRDQDASIRVVFSHIKLLIDRVRVDAANSLRHAPWLRKVVKSSRYLLYKRPENLSEKEHTKLAELSKLNTPLLKCYLMGDELRHLWSLGTRGQAIALVMDWIHRATHSRIKPLVDFGKNLRGYVQGIIAAADFKINTSVLEGVNNKIKQIKRRAYGFRDDLYFFLKVKAAFHGLPR